MYHWEGQHLFTIWPNGCVWVVPCPELQEIITRHAHEELGHFGVCRIYSLFQGQYGWKGMQLEIQFKKKDAWCVIGFMHHLIHPPFFYILY